MFRCWCFSVAMLTVLKISTIKTLILFWTRCGQYWKSEFSRTRQEILALLCNSFQCLRSSFSFRTSGFDDFMLVLYCDKCQMWKNNFLPLFRKFDKTVFHPPLSQLNIVIEIARKWMKSLACVMKKKKIVIFGTYFLLTTEWVQW